MKAILRVRPKRKSISETLERGCDPKWFGKLRKEALKNTEEEFKLILKEQEKQSLQLMKNMKS